MDMRWEYKVVKLNSDDPKSLERSLDDWGEAGWELVAAYPNAPIDGHAPKLVAVFKSVAVSIPSLETRIHAR
jgi:hypothetical protein